MKNIILTVSYGSHTDCLTITQKTTWSDLRASIFDYSQLSVTQLYYRDREGDIIAFSSDGELDSLKQQCSNGWLHFSTDPTTNVRWVFDNSFIHHQDDLGQQSITSTDPNAASIPSKKPSIDNIATTSFTSQFEQFGKLMDRYNDLIQQDEQVKAIMHQTATEITLQHSKVDLSELENRLENYYLDNSSKTPYRQYTKLSSGTLNNTYMGLSRSATTAATSSRTIKRRPMASLYFDHDNTNDRSWSTPSSNYPDVPPPSYETQLPTTSTQHSDEKENKKREQRRHTHYGNFDQQSFPSSSWGEWPAYSSLHPPPPPSSQGINDDTTSSPPPPTAPELHKPPSPSAPSLPLDSIQQHPSQRPPMSLYPQPPILPALLKRTSRLLSHWVPPLATPRPPSPPRQLPHPSIGMASRSTSAMNNSSYQSHYGNANDTKNRYTSNDFSTSSCKRKQKGKQHEIQTDIEYGKDYHHHHHHHHHHHRFSDLMRNRQLYKEQQRSLRQQQKELARTQRHLERQEKRDRKEDRRQQRQARHARQDHNNNTRTPSIHNSLPPLSQQNEKRHKRWRSDDSSSNNNNNLLQEKQYGRRTPWRGDGDDGKESIRKSSSISSLSSMSSSSSQQTCSSMSSSSTLSSSSSSPHTLENTRQQQHQQSVLEHHHSLQYPSIPGSLVQHHHSSTPGSNDQYRRHYDDDDDQLLDDKLDKHDMQHLANAFNHLSTSIDAPPIVPRKQ